AALVDDVRSAGVDDIYGVYATRGGVQSIIVLGPNDPSGVGDTPSRRRIFICRPQSAAAETPCARSIVAKLATRAFRTPHADDAVVERIMTFYEQGHAQGGFEAGVQSAIARMLVDPRFLFRFENAASPQNV